MGTWLQSFTQTCCESLSNVYRLSQAIVSGLNTINQHYDNNIVLVTNNYSGSAAQAFTIAATNNEDRLSFYSDCLNKAAFTAQTLQNIIASSSAAADARLTNVSSINLPPVNSVEIVDELVRQALAAVGDPQAALNSILTTGSAAWYSTSWLLGTHPWFDPLTPGADPLGQFIMDSNQTQHTQAISREVQSILQTWSEELHQAYTTFHTTLTTGIFPTFTPSIIEGNPFGYAGPTFNHQQGQNSLGADEDCGLASSADVLNQFGIPVNENEVVLHAQKYNEMIMQGKQSNWGEMYPSDIVKLLGDYGVPAHVATYGSIGGMITSAPLGFEQLANEVEQRKDVILEVNADVIWADGTSNDTANGAVNHFVAVTGVAVNAWTGKVEGFYVNDSGNGESAEYVTTATLQQAWINAQGGDTAVVTNQPHPENLPPG